MAIVPAFYTTNDEDDPVWHDNDQCEEGKKILEENKAYGIHGRKCDICEEIDDAIKNSPWK